MFEFTYHKVNHHLINYLLLVFKCYIYKIRENGSLGLQVLKINSHKKKNIEKQVSLNKAEKQKHFEQEWKWWCNIWGIRGVILLFFHFFISIFFLYVVVFYTNYIILLLQL